MPDSQLNQHLVPIKQAIEHAEQALTDDEYTVLLNILLIQLSKAQRRVSA